MSVTRTAHRCLAVCRTGVAGAAAVILLTACGGDGGSSTDDADSTAAETGAASEEFCNRAGDIDERVDEVLAELGDGSSVPEAIHATADELRAIEAPPAISDDWTALVDGLDQIADALADLDITDGESVAALEDIGNRLDSASTNVENYLDEECGIN